MQPRLTARPVGAHVTVKLAGELDASAVAELRTFLLAALDQGWVYLVINLAEAERIDVDADTEMLDNIARRTHHLGGCCHVIPPEQLTSRGELVPSCLTVEDIIAEDPSTSQNVLARTIDQEYGKSALTREVPIRGSPRLVDHERVRVRACSTRRWAASRSR